MKIYGLFPNCGSADPPLKSGHLQIKDAQCAKKSDGRKISYRIWAPKDVQMAPQKGNFLQKGPNL